MSTRRKFLQSALVSSAAVLTGEQLVAGTDKDRRTLISQPIVISTWDFGKAANAEAWNCLLYTSDAADERSSVDLGGRRIIKKKNENPRLRRIVFPEEEI